MFCNQCQETARNQGCTVKGVCGKTDEVAALQDALVYALQGLASVAAKSGAADPAADKLIMEGLFATVTNVNFDPAYFVARIGEAVAKRDAIKLGLDAAALRGLPAAANWNPRTGDQAELVTLGRALQLFADPAVNEDVRSLRSLVVFGLRGLAAYTDHAAVLGHEDGAIYEFLRRGLALTADDSATGDDLVAAALECGKVGVTAMALLDGANTGAYGTPAPTQVNLGVKPGPAILISGHDLRDLHDLLEQTKGAGVNVYTHGEMLPAHAYPVFKQYPNLVGNYGNAWWKQTDEFDKFGGAILMTTNCLVPPKDSYKDRLFTTGLVGWPGVAHIADRAGDAPKDFSAVIAKALASAQPLELETGTVWTGFAHDAVLGVADKVIAAIQSGAIKRFVVMAGCDGRQNGRAYFSDVAKGLPSDSIILTAGCAKYRYNKLPLGDIAGIPRVLDAGQCNDSYSLVAVALKLAEVLGVESVNDLPIQYDIAWYEQKAVLVLLSLLSLGVKKIRLGPTLPAFLSPNVAKVLVEKFDLRPTTTAEADLETIVAGA